MILFFYTTTIKRRLAGLQLYALQWDKWIRVHSYSAGVRRILTADTYYYAENHLKKTIRSVHIVCLFSVERHEYFSRINKASFFIFFVRTIQSNQRFIRCWVQRETCDKLKMERDHEVLRFRVRGSQSRWHPPFILNDSFWIEIDRKFISVGTISRPFFEIERLHEYT